MEISLLDKQDPALDVRTFDPEKHVSVWFHYAFPVGVGNPLTLETPTTYN